MSEKRSSANQIKLKTIDVERRNYGRRYTGLPVDTLDKTGFTIDCTHAYMRPIMFDLQQGDIVRWLHNGRYMQGSITRVERTDAVLSAALQDVVLLPPDFFAG
jgi:hypothetical protein